MGTFLSILLDILAILIIIIVGSLVVVIFAELILHMLDGGRRKKKDDDEAVARVVKDDDIVVYSGSDNPNAKKDGVVKVETIDGDKIEEIDYDKAVEEQKMLQSRMGQSAPAPVKETPVEAEPDNNDIFWDDDEDEEFNKLLDEVVKEAKNVGEEKEEKPEEPKKVVKEEPKAKLSDETKEELAELKELKEQQKKEIEEIRQMREDFAREKEEQLAMLKDNLTKAKEEELERIRQEALREQEKLEKMQDELELEKQKLAEEREKLKEAKEEPAASKQEPIVKETIIKDEEEINKLKYRNLMRMNNRLTRIIRDTERLQNQQTREKEKAEEEKRRLLAEQDELRKREQERLIEITRQEQEKLRRQQEELDKREEISKKLQEAGRRAGKYKLDTKVVKVVRELPVDDDDVIEERVIADDQETTIPSKKELAPVFEKEYYEQRLVELDEELKEAEKELRQNKSEYVPLKRIHKAYARDSEKLRKKELVVAKQKVALYGVNSKNVDPVKKAKLDENLQALAELKDSVQHCEEVIRKNKDRFPVIEKNNQLITKHIERINDEIKVCEKALENLNKK